VPDGGEILNIQIFGKSKCFDTKKAERYFKERRIKYQYVDLLRYGLSGKEFDAVLRGVGGIDKLIDWEGKAPDITLMRYMDDARAKEDKVFDNPALMKTPIVRNGKAVTVGYCPEIWQSWE
jgi:arsenate reductase-like glutaredoxin family protein